jgi:hypothetical protein
MEETSGCPFLRFLKGKGGRRFVTKGEWIYLAESDGNAPLQGIVPFLVHLVLSKLECLIQHRVSLKVL